MIAEANDTLILLNYVQSVIENTDNVWQVLENEILEKSLK